MVPLVSITWALVKSAVIGTEELDDQTASILPSRTKTLPWLMTLFSLTIVTTRPLRRKASVPASGTLKHFTMLSATLESGSLGPQPGVGVT